MKSVPRENRCRTHKVVYTTPAHSWDEGLPLGNGLMGALVWGDGDPLILSLDRTDLWDLRPVPEYQASDYSYAQMRHWHTEGRVEDLIRLYEAPYNRPAPTKIPAGRIALRVAAPASFASAELDLETAHATVTWTDGSRMRIAQHATRPVGFAVFNGPAPVSLKLIAPQFAGKVDHAASGDIRAGDLTQLGYPAPMEHTGPTWLAFTQQGAEGFSFAVYLAWRMHDDTLTLAWSIASAFEEADPLTLARTRVESALEAGFEQAFSDHHAWWNTYWNQSAIRLPNPALERLWYLEQYKFGAASRRGAPPITLQGPWTADDGQLPPWKGDYHHDLNTQLSYWPCYSGNHLEEGLSFLDWLWQTRPECFAWTKRFFGLPGLNVPMTADLKNNQIGGWRQYTHSATTSAWLAHHFYLHWRYSMDRVFLRERAYPYLRDVAVFLEAITAERDGSNQRTLPLSSSPEINNNQPEAWFPTITNYDLALIRWLFDATAELATELDLTDEATHWRQILEEMPDFARGEDGRLLVARDHPLQESHRHFSHLMAIHPLGLIAWQHGPSARTTIKAALSELDQLGPDWWCGYSYAWLASIAARAGDGARAESALEVFANAFTLRNSFHCNGDQSGQGYSRFTYRPFTLEGNFAAAAGIQEMLLQSHGGAIRVFPAIPETWNDVSFTTLRAEGAILVSARRVQGVTVEIVVEAERDGMCQLAAPFGGADVELVLQAGEVVRLTRPPDTPDANIQG